tara:strand:+ start:46115 stop:46555 length:441 start_codon:yes stop_codon:yes gene_type:complete
MKELNRRFINQITNNNLLALSIGLVYLLFGVLKFFTSLSPAEDVAIQTINRLTLGLVPAQISITFLSIWESGIGIFLILNWYRKTTILFALVHITMTFTPLFLSPEIIFSNASLAPTLLGQYIFKNIIIVAALITVLQNKTPSYAS